MEKKVKLSHGLESRREKARRISILSCQNSSPALYVNSLNKLCNGGVISLSLISKLRKLYITLVHDSGKGMWGERGNEGGNI